MPLEKKIARRNSMFSQKKRKGSLAKFADSTIKLAKDMGSMLSLRTMSGSMENVNDGAGKRDNAGAKKNVGKKISTGAPLANRPLYRHPEPVKSGNISVLNVAIGKKINFKRTSGAVQYGVMVKLNVNKDTVRVEWEENGHVKVKDIDIATFNELNADGVGEEVDEDIQMNNEDDDNMGIVKPKQTSMDKKTTIPLKSSTLAESANKRHVGEVAPSRPSRGRNMAESDDEMNSKKTRAEMMAMNYRSVDNLNSEFSIDEVEKSEATEEFETNKARFLLWFKPLQENEKLKVIQMMTQNISSDTDVTPIYKMYKKHKRQYDERHETEKALHMQQSNPVNSDVYNVVGSKHAKVPKEMRRRRSSMAIEAENPDQIGMGSLHNSKARLNKSVSKLSPIKNKKDKHLDPVSKLPPTLSAHIFCFLDPSSLAHASLACKMWKHIANSTFVWEKMCAKNGWKLSPEELNGVDKSRIDWKAYYQMRDNDEYRVQLNWADARYGARTLSGHDGTVMSLFYTGHFVVTGSYDNTLRVWNAKTGECVRKLAGHSGGITAVTVSGDIVYSGSEDKTIKKWDINTGQCLSSCEEMQKKITCLKLYSSGHSQLLISGSSDGIIRAFDENFGVAYLLKGHTESVTCLSLYQTALASGGDDTTIRVWDLQGRYCNHVLWNEGQRPITGLYLNASVIIAGTVDPDISVFDRLSLSIIFKFKGHSYAVRSIAVTDNLKYMVSCSTDRTVRVWNMPEFDLKARKSITYIDRREHKKKGYILKYHKDRLEYEVRTEDQDVGDEPYFVKRNELLAMNCPDQTCLTVLKDHTASVNCVATDNYRIISAGGDSVAKIWDFTVS
eukprot:Nk52_evm27s292 gene=Nk52_evmTU27s292